MARKKVISNITIAINQDRLRWRPHQKINQAVHVKLVIQKHESYRTITLYTHARYIFLDLWHFHNEFINFTLSTVPTQHLFFFFPTVERSEINSEIHYFSLNKISTYFNELAHWQKQLMDVYIPVELFQNV